MYKMRGLYSILLLCCFLDTMAMQKNDPESIRLNQLIDSGKIAMQHSNYTQALKQFNSCLQLSDKTPTEHIRERCLAYLNIGNIHSVFSDYERAYTFYLKGYTLCKSLNKPEMEFKFLNNMTGICCFMKNSDQAIKYNEIAHKLSLADKNQQEYTYTLNKGYIASSMNNKEMALSYFIKSVEQAQKFGLEPQFVAAPYSEICIIYENSNQLDSAILYLKKYNKLAEDSQLAYMVVDSYKSLMKVYTKKGDKDSVIYYQNRYLHLSDSLMNVREFYKVTNEQQTYETDQSNQQIEHLNIKLSAWQKTVSIAVLILLLSAVFTYFIYKQKKKLRDSYQYLFDRNKELVKIENQYRTLLSSKKSLSDDRSRETANADNKQPDIIDADRKAEILNAINEIMETTDEFCNPEFSLNMLAKMVNSNTKYVSQIINETYDKNFRTYINEYRVKEARKRLMEEKYGNYTIQGIAESVGYKSSTNFILAFKKATGITPSLYQKLVKTDKNRPSDPGYPE